MEMDMHMDMGKEIKIVMGMEMVMVMDKGPTKKDLEPKHTKETIQVKRNTNKKLCNSHHH